MPPTLFVALAYPWYKLARAIFPYHIALAVYSGGIAGYITYDMTHYFLHHRRYVLGIGRFADFLVYLVIGRNLNDTIWLTITRISNWDTVSRASSGI